MLIIGADYHPSFQQISFLDQETGECGDRRLNHSDGEAERFYQELKERGISVRVGFDLPEVGTPRRAPASANCRQTRCLGN